MIISFPLVVWFRSHGEEGSTVIWETGSARRGHCARNGRVTHQGMVYGARSHPLRLPPVFMHFPSLGYTQNRPPATQTVSRRSSRYERRRRRPSGAHPFRGPSPARGEGDSPRSFRLNRTNRPQMSPDDFRRLKLRRFQHQRRGGGIADRDVVIARDFAHVAGDRGAGGEPV